ncbi:hypothetical protein [Agromyces bauzanensis]|uniref:DUF2892 domain-containing protein n=1 Tax=Agromyces bauzanensis TaxID=1308924 RepID=A0A917PKA3_9MICO|nr:hypothetical protein [Agromyces bauzanensis]GGJ82010.1 hypothetical protein GCM10011372_20540 [Agromyces bauzanensis]
MTQGARRGWFASPRVRRVLARIVVVIGVLLGLIGLLTARWGLLFVGIIVIGLGAAMGPARIRRD